VECAGQADSSDDEMEIEADEAAEAEEAAAPAVVEAEAAGAAAPVAEAEGLRLHLSSSSSTGYKGVSKGERGNSGRFRAQTYTGGETCHLGFFDTAVEAAVAYARAVGEYQPQPPPTVATEAEGLKLHLSDKSATGYKGVREMESGRFYATRKDGGQDEYLGSFDSAVEAAVAYARAVGQAKLEAGEEEEEQEEGDEEEGGEEEGGAPIYQVDKIVEERVEGGGLEYRSGGMSSTRP